MARTLTVVCTFAAAALFSWLVPLARIFGGLQPLVVAFSIMIAAVFVRLNRGMPSFEWKAVKPRDRANLTSAVVSLSAEYGWLLLLMAVGLTGMVSLTMIGKATSSSWPEWVQRIGSAAIGGIIALCAARMCYVVWRDIDIIKLQKQLIDDAATNELSDQDMLLAERKVADIQAASVRKIDVPPPETLS